MGSVSKSQAAKSKVAKSQAAKSKVAKSKVAWKREGCAKLERCDLPPAVMAILNLTPDSFSGDGLLSVKAGVNAGDKSGEDGFNTRLLRAAERALRAGADWLDVGAQSTRPGATSLSLEAERTRLLPSLEALFRAFPEALVSVDTSKAELAIEVVRLGAHMVNDVSGEARPDLWRRLGEQNNAEDKERGWLVLMHNAASRLHRGSMREGGYSWQPKQEEASDLPSVLANLRALAQACVEAGLPREKIVLDPGLGFGKTLEQNVALLRSWSKIVELGFPTMLGASRKSFLGKLLAQEDELQSPSQHLSQHLSKDLSDRLEGSLAACAAAMLGGVRILRVHDVAETVRFVRVFYPLSCA